MIEEELKKSLMNCCAVVDDALEELKRELQEIYNVRPPVEIKKEIKHEKNPMRLKQLNRELNESYKVYRKKRK